MKILLPGSKFISAVNWITKVSDSRTPQLAAVVIRAEDETALEARNWDVFASTEASSTVVEPGTVAVSGQGLSLVAAQIKATDDVTLTHDGSKLAISRGRATWTLPEMPAEFLPRLPELGEQLGTISGEVLKAGIAAVAPALAADVKVEGYEFAALTGIECTFGEDLTLAATDRFHLATVDLEWKGACEQQSLVIPPSLAKLLAKDLDTEARLFFDGQQLSVVTDTRRLIGRLLGGKYVPWRGAMPDPLAATTTVTVNAAELLAAVRSVSVFNVVDTTHRGDLVELRFEPDSIELIGHSADSSKGDGAKDVVVPEEFTGEPVTVFCQHPYLVDVLRAIPDGSAVLHLTEPNRPVLITTTTGCYYRGVLVPVHRGGA